MAFENENINETIYTICMMIQNICKLDVEFIGCSTNTSFDLYKAKTPISLLSSKHETFSYIHQFLKDKLPNDFLCHTDQFQMNYIAAGYFEQSEYCGTIIVGPFISVIPDEAFISKIIERNHLPLGQRLQLQNYYNSLNIFSVIDNKNIGYLLINLASKPFLSGNMLFSENKTTNTRKNKNIDLDEQTLYSETELRYKIEKNIMKAIEKGSKEEALKAMDLFQYNASHRSPGNPLRAFKNLGFALGTISRIACERGGVAPIYVHNLSNKYAVLIENVSSMAELETHRINMISEYCDLVNKFSTAGYSPSIRKAIDFIHLNFDTSISLNLIAQSINLNPSHLSRQFKKETNRTITEFINNKRVDEAKFLIEQNNHSITEIALMVGYENHNYFCKVFKQITSLTPTEYLNKTKREA